MLIINPASAGGARYWECSAVYTTWLGRGAPLLGLSGAVDVAELRTLMLGRGPDGVPLTSRPGLRRRHGWDLIFAAPKSVSLLADAGPPGSTGPLRASFRLAVADAVSALEDRAAWLRSGGEQVAAKGVVAASFEHLANDAGHPHLHAHVVLANIGAKAGLGWGCLVSNELWRWREALGAGFHLALRSRLAEAGFGFSWELSNGGLGEIAAVPSGARYVASSRSRGLRAGARSFGSASSASQRAAQGMTRRAKARDGATFGAARPDLATTGWGPDQAAEVLRQALGRAALPPPPPAGAAVARALAARGSLFGEPDVLVAMAETSPAGYNLRQAADWSRHWCEQCHAVAMAPPGPGKSDGTTQPTSRTARRWTTAVASEIDRRVLDLVSEARFAHLAQVSPLLAVRELEDLGTTPGVAPTALALACDGAGVAVLPKAPWLAQAACIDAARAAWQAAGMTVRVTCPTELSARRWRALTSLQPAAGYAAGADLGSHPGKRVLVVDAADRISPTSLVTLVDQASSTKTKLVLVLGGTVASSGESLARALDQLGTELAVPSLGHLPAGLVLAPDRATNPALVVRGIPVRGALSGRGAMAHLVASWSAGARALVPPLMVAFGPPEVEALNTAARSVFRVAGAAELALGERRYGVGDHVLALRRTGPARSATQGTVVALGPRSLTVEWRGPSGPCRSVLGQEDASSLGYGYATTVPYLRSGDAEHQSLLVLGDPHELGGRSNRVEGAWVTLAGPGMPVHGPAGVTARRRAGLAELATCWPDEAMLERAGPRPLAPTQRRRWAETVASYALERDLGLDVATARMGPAQHGLALGLSPRL